MTKTEAIIRSILGPIGTDIRPLACAVDITAELIFKKKIPIDEVRVTKDIYPIVAKQLGKSASSISKKIERLSNLCWDAGDVEVLQKIIGKRLYDIRAPRDMLFYLAYYTYLDMSFFEAMIKKTSSIPR